MTDNILHVGAVACELSTLTVRQCEELMALQARLADDTRDRIDFWVTMIRMSISRQHREITSDALRASLTLPTMRAAVDRICEMSNAAFDSDTAIFRREHVANAAVTGRTYLIGKYSWQM